MPALLLKLAAALAKFAGPVAGSVAGYVNKEELVKTFLTALSAAGIAFVGTFQSGLGNVFDPSIVSLVAFLLTHAADAFRRLNHGK